MVRDRDGLLAAIDRRIAQERAIAPGRRITREGVVRELLLNWLRYMASP